VALTRVAEHWTVVNWTVPQPAGGGHCNDRWIESRTFYGSQDDCKHQQTMPGKLRPRAPLILGQVGRMVKRMVIIIMLLVGIFDMLTNRTIIITAVA
jgi:hypothetical protein